MSTLGLPKSDEIVKCDEVWSVSNNIPKRRWRLAITVIYFTTVLVSLTKKVLDKDGPLLRTLSYVAIDVQDKTVPSLLSVDPKKLSDMVRNKNSETLREFGGVKDLAFILQTPVKNGINGDEADLIQRHNIFGTNKYPKPPAKKFLRFVYEALKDTTILILLACAMLSLAFGIKQHGWKDGWYDGGSIIVAVFLVVAVSAGSDYKQSREFQKLSTKSSDIRGEVVRDGRRQPVSIFDVVVGDIVCLKIGEQIPADGLFLEGHSLKVDESSMTGESDPIQIDERNPFMLSGTKITDGFGFMLVTSVGMNTAWGEMMSSINRELNEETPLQARLNKLASYIGKVGLVVAALVLVVMLIRYFTGNTKDDRGNKEFNGSKTKFDDVMNAVLSIVSAAVTIIVVATPKGLPLAVTLTLAYSMKCMMADHAMVRKLSSCETMGSATIICTDKTGTLTLNEMKVTEFWLGKEAMEDDNYSKLAGNILKLLQHAVGLNTTGTVYKPNSTSVPEVSGSPTEKAILSWAVFNLGMNIEEVKQDYHKIHVETFNSAKKRSGVLVRNNNEKTIHTHWKGAAEMILAMCSAYYDRAGVLKVMDEEERLQLETIIKNMAQKSLRCIGFAHKEVTEESEQPIEKLEENGLTLLALVGMKDPCRPGVSTAVETCKAAGVNVKMITGDNVHTAKAIAFECKILKPNEDVGDEAVVEGVQFRNYSPEERMEKVDKIHVMARSSPVDKLLMVQCLKQKGHVVAVIGDGTNDAPALKEADIGLSMGIQGTEVAKESSDIVILDDNFTTVVTVLRWGRVVHNNIQKFLQFQLTVNVAALVINFVAAVSSSKVPLTAVQLLWVNLIMDTLGAVTGDGTNDAPALKEADIGLSMGIQGTEVAKESSDIVILDDNFTTVETVLRWGRVVYNNIQKFLQFQLLVNVAILVIYFVAAVSSGKVPLTAVQLLWVNIIMDTLRALALATEKPTNDLMSKPPVGRSKPLITRIMWRNLMAQAVYQVTTLLVLQFKGKSIFGVNENVKNTLIFNTFVLCQVFNEFNSRKLDKKNIFKGILKNKLFLAIVGITIVLQLVMVEFLNRFANTERLDWGQWGACIGLAALSWPIGWLIKCIPVSGKKLANKRASPS